MGTCADCGGTDDENRRAKLTARPTRVMGVDKKITARPREHGRVMTLRKKNPGDGLGRDRGRPGLEAPGKLWQPAALGRANQLENPDAPERDVPSRAAWPERGPLETDAQRRTEGRWTCWHCGAVWEQEAAKH